MYTKTLKVIIFSSQIPIISQHASLRPQYFLTAVNNAKRCWRV